jgi:hypothetical protein
MAIGGRGEMGKRDRGPLSEAGISIRRKHAAEGEKYRSRRHKSEYI